PGHRGGGVSAVGVPLTTAATSAGAGERFAARAGVRLVDGSAEGPCGCQVVARLVEPDDAAGGIVPPAAVIVLVEAAARAAPLAPLTDRDERGEAPVLVLAAAGVHLHGPAGGPLTAVATVPGEGRLADRADTEGGLRFSVAVDVRDASGASVAAGSVQWT